MSARSVAPRVPPPHRREKAAAGAPSAIVVDAAATKATAGMSGTKPKPKAKPRNKKGQPAKRKRR